MDGLLSTRLHACAEELRRIAAQGDAAVAGLAATMARDWPAVAREGEATARALAQTCIDAIAAIPVTVVRLQAALDAPGSPPALRHAIVLALVYLVRRDDLVPDDARGGCGRVDDWMVLSLALVGIVNEPRLRRQLLAAWAGEPAARRTIEADIEAWRQQTMDAIGFVMAYAPPGLSHNLRRVLAGSLMRYDQCLELEARDAAALERRTLELIANPELPDEVMIGPVADDALWLKWQQRVADEQSEARRLAEFRDWMAWSRQPSRYVSPYKIARLPNGGFVAGRRG